VNLVGLYSDVPGHTLYAIVDTDRAEKLEAIFDSDLEIGHAEVRPVTDGLATFRRRAGQG
jgi:hypothetical protein